MTTADIELSELKLRLRNYRGALKKLEKAKGFNNRLYWTQAIKHWENELDQHLITEEPGGQIKILVDQFRANLKVLRKEAPAPIVDDLDYRFNAIVDTLLKDSLQSDGLKEQNQKIIRR